MRKSIIGIGLAVAATFMAAGASAETRGVTPTEVVFGMHTDLSGVGATYGVSSSNAARMRFDEVNDSGGVGERKIRFALTKMLVVVGESTRTTAPGSMSRLANPKLPPPLKINVPPLKTVVDP